MTNSRAIVSEDISNTIAIGQQVYDKAGTKVGAVDMIDRPKGYITVHARPLPEKRDNPFSEKSFYVPFRLITNIDPQELFLSVSREELHRDYANPPPRSTRVYDEDGREIAITTEPSGYDGAPIVVLRIRLDPLKKAITVGDHVFTSERTELGTITQYDPATGRIWIAGDETECEPNMQVPVAVVSAVDREAHRVYLVSSQADLARLQHLETA